MFRVDLHTHSVASPDGGISADQYAHALSTGLLDVIAITDHNQIDFALNLKDQGGLVYIPHPFETVRKGLHPATLEELIDYVDVVEICNGRVLLQNRSA